MLWCTIQMPELWPMHSFPSHWECWVRTTPSWVPLQELPSCEGNGGVQGHVLPPAAAPFQWRVHQGNKDLPLPCFNWEHIPRAISALGLPLGLSEAIAVGVDPRLCLPHPVLLTFSMAFESIPQETSTFKSLSQSLFPESNLGSLASFVWDL